MNPLAQELATYNANLQTLIPHHGKFVLIKGDKVIDFFDTYADAMRIGYEKFSLEPFLVKCITPPEQPLFVSRSIVPCHQSACR